MTGGCVGAEGAGGCLAGHTMVELVETSAGLAPAAV